jgi:hypothetical protein
MAQASKERAGARGAGMTARLAIKARSTLWRGGIQTVYGRGPAKRKLFTHRLLTVSGLYDHWAERQHQFLAKADISR